MDTKLLPMLTLTTSIVFTVRCITSRLKTLMDGVEEQIEVVVSPPLSSRDTGTAAAEASSLSRGNQADVV